MSGRDRSEGWRHAKISGHKYESSFCNKIIQNRDSELNRALNLCVKKRGIDSQPKECDSSSGTTLVEDIFGGKTQSKRDVTIFFENNSKIGISIKKASTLSGQVHLSTLSRFIDAMEIMIDEDVPVDVKWVFQAFTGETDGKSIKEFTGVTKLHSPINQRHKMNAEKYQNRLYASTIQKEFPEKWLCFKNWFEKYIPEITDLVFSRGYCLNKKDFAEVLYYGNGNHFFIINELVEKSKGTGIFPSRHGYYKGSTIHMPWGFLQVHRPGKHEGPFQLQFHHRLKDIQNLMK